MHLWRVVSLLIEDSGTVVVVWWKTALRGAEIDRDGECSGAWREWSVEGEARVMCGVFTGVGGGRRGDIL